MYKATKRKFPLRAVSILIVFLLLVPTLISFAEPWHNENNVYNPLTGQWEYSPPLVSESQAILNGDLIYIDTDKVFISATPHTIDSGWVYVNITSKTWSGLADIAVGFENTDTRINEVELYNPHTETINELLTVPAKYLTDPYKTNYTYSSSHGNDVFNGTIYVWGNVTMYPANDPEGALYGSDPTGWVWQLVYQHDFEEFDTITYLFSWTEYNEIIWENVVDRLSWVVKDKEAFDMNRWYLTNFNVQSGTEYYFRFRMYTKPSLVKSLSKYTIVLKPAAETIEEAFANEHIYVLDPWLAGGWDQRVKVTIDSGDIDTANLTNFPVLLYLSTSSGYNSEDITFIFDEIAADANRKKIAVTTSDGETECFVEIEKWSQATEKAWLWVKVPNVAFASDTDLYLYYDADHADNTDYVDDTNTGNSTSVWDSNFVAVHHKDGTQATEVDDSTDQDNDVASAGGTPDYDSTGIMGSDCVGYVEASSEYLQITDAAELDGFSTFAAWESWIYVTNHTAVNIHPIMSKWGAEDAYYIWQSWASPDNNIWLYYSVDGSVLSYNYADMNALSDATWYHLGIVWEDSVLPKFYLNGVLLTTLRTDTSTDIFGANTNLQLAGYTVGGTYWDGRLDEMRISNAERKAEWMAATYETGIDELLDWGAEEQAFDVTVTWTFQSTTTTTTTGTTSSQTNTDTTTTSTAETTISTDKTTSTGAGGAFPVIEDITETTPQSGSTHTIDYPTTVDVGDLLIVVFTCDDDEATLTCADFNQLYKEDAGPQGPTLYVGWREAVGDEDGTTFTIVTGTTEGSCAYVFRISGAEDPDTQPPEVSLTASGSSVNPNSLSLTPTGGSKNYLFISAEGNDDDDDTTVWPTNMADNNIFSQETTVTLGIATEEVADSVFDPDQFTIAASESWEAVTIGIHPTAPPVTTITSVTTTSTTSCETLLSTEYTTSCGTTELVTIWTVIQIIYDPTTTIYETSTAATQITCVTVGSTSTVQEGTTCTTEASTSTDETTTTICDTSVASSTSSTTTCETSVDSSTSSTTTCDTSVDSSTSSTTTCDTSVDSSTESTTICDTSIISSTETTTICDTSIVSSTETTTICETSTETETLTETETETETVCETSCLTSEITETSCATITVTHTTECETLCETSTVTEDTTTTTCETSVETSKTTTTTCDTSIDSSTSSTTTCDTSVKSSTSSTTTCDTSVKSSTSSTTTCATETDTETETVTVCETTCLTSEITETSCATITLTHTTECDTTCETSTSTSETTSTTCETSVSTSETTTTTCDTSIFSSTSSTTTCETSVDSSTSSTTTCDTSVVSSTETTTVCDTSIISSTETTTICATETETETVCETSCLTSEIVETSCATITVTHTTETETVCETSTSTSETTTTTCDTSIYSSTSSTTTCDTDTDSSTYSSTSSTTTCDTSVYSSTSSTTTCDTSIESSTSTSCKTTTITHVTSTSTTCETLTETECETTCETTTITSVSSTTTCDSSTYSSTSSTTTCDTSVDSSTSSTTTCETSVYTSESTSCVTQTITHTTECTTSCETTTIITTYTSGTQVTTSETTTTTCDTSVYSSTSSTTTCTSSVSTSETCTTTCETSVLTSETTTTTCDTSVKSSTSSTTTCDTSIISSTSTSCKTTTITHVTSTSTSCETLTETECETTCETTTDTSVSSTTTCTSLTGTSISSTTTCTSLTQTSISSTTTCTSLTITSVSSTTTCSTETEVSEIFTTTCTTATETETETSCETTTVTHTTECSTTCETLTETETETTCETSTSTSISSTTTCTSLTDSSVSSTTTCTSSTDSSVSSTTTCTSLTDTSISSTTTCSTSTSISSTTTCETLTSIATTCTTTCDTDTDVVQKTKCVTVTQTHTTSTSTSCETLTSITTTSTTTSSTITSTFTSESTSLTTTSTCTSTSTSSCITTTLFTTITSGTQTTTTAVDTVVYDGCVLDEFDNDDLVALYNNTERDVGGWVQVLDDPDTQVPIGILNVTGIRDSGDLSSVQARDANTYNLSEVGGAPGFSIVVNFTLDADFTGLDVHLLYAYDGPGGHTIEVQVWNFTSSAWVDTPNNPVQSTPLVWCNNTNIGDYQHLRGPGPDYNITVRLYHSSPGNVNDDFAIDYIEITSDVCVCGYVWSENMLASLNVTSIVNFRYNITIPVFSGAFAKIQFSQDNATWVDSGGINQWEDMSTGDNSILLTGLGWGGNFYYRTHMNKDLNGTSPELDLVQVCYSSTVAGGGNWNFIIVIAVILSALAIPIMMKRRR